MKLLLSPIHLAFGKYPSFHLYVLRKNKYKWTGIHGIPTPIFSHVMACKTQSLLLTNRSNINQRSLKIVEEYLPGNG
jgi:hypothetical protein